MGLAAHDVKFFGANEAANQRNGELKVPSLTGEANE